MAVSIPEIKKAAAIISDVYGITGADSLRLVRSFGGDTDMIRGILSGDLSSVPGAAASVGVVLGDTSAKDHIKDITPGASAADGVNTSEKITAKRSRRAASDRVKASKKDHAINNHADNKTAVTGLYKPMTDTKNNTDINGYDNTLGGSAGLPDVLQDSETIPTVDGDILPADDPGGLPVGFSDMVTGWLQDYAIQYNIDLEKCAAIQWRSLCLSIGEKIQASGVLRDHAREKTHGGKIYNPFAVAALVPIWEKLTGYYKHIPLVVDFVAFAGVSHEWFYDTRGVLTSGRVEIAKKVRMIEEAALSASLCDSRENPTGRIYYTKARLGWREVSEIVHTSAKETHAGGALPVFDSSGGFLTDNAV